jgi:gamma-glutamylcyclotransferase (GGCT)/AIG2-like uncharacterized protein YtfP
VVHKAQSRRLIAVYGLLMTGLGGLEAAGVVGALRYRQECVIPGAMLDLGSYPGLVRGPGEVRGELHELIDPGALDALDAYEGYDPDDHGRSRYIRRVVTLLRPNARAWVYHYHGLPDGYAVIASGSWRAERGPA